ncbi:hypothetical protein BLNAU_15295 [Blattamonas nauphoetae]|uniref:Uncharacterized protein n=1 Tax=Blattamonas nauphoetae TaxID=2049346 RepID=A0ABQ9XHE6_9EUKA|nr:hypothetical protein BLNAU_15295 [Blattamonas nauphoetae]
MQQKKKTIRKSKKLEKMLPKQLNSHPRKTLFHVQSQAHPIKPALVPHHPKLNQPIKIHLKRRSHLTKRWKSPLLNHPGHLDEKVLVTIVILIENLIETISIKNPPKNPLQNTEDHDTRTKNLILFWGIVNQTLILTPIIDTGIDRTKVIEIVIHTTDLVRNIGMSININFLLFHSF